MDVSALFGLLTTGAGLLAGRPGKGKATDAWQTAAETYGLLYRPASFWKGPRLSGSLAGNRLTVDIKDRNTASAATRFRLGMTPLNLGLRMKKKGFWNSLRPRTVVGDRAFDNQVVVDGRNRLAVQEFLTPERRTAIQGFLGSFKAAAVTDDEISFKIRGDVKKSDDMLGAIEAMQRVATVLADEPHPGTAGRATRAAVAAVSPADTAEVGALEVEPAPEPELASEPAREPDPEREAGPGPERNAAPDPAPDPEVTQAGEPRLTDAPTDVPDTPTESKSEATPPTDAFVSKDNTPGVDEFCATVFAPGVLSFRATQIFRDSYEGRQVAWTGTLESMTPFTFDFDFGSGSGIKAVLTILENLDAGSRNVQAVIGLPPGSEGLEDRIGQPVSFTGRLLKVDGLAKRVIVASAALGL